MDESMKSLRRMRSTSSAQSILYASGIRVEPHTSFFHTCSQKDERSNICEGIDRRCRAFSPVSCYERPAPHNPILSHPIKESKKKKIQRSAQSSPLSLQRLCSRCAHVLPDCSPTPFLLSTSSLPHITSITYTRLANVAQLLVGNHGGPRPSSPSARRDPWPHLAPVVAAGGAAALPALPALYARVWRDAHQCPRRL